ncbi:protein KRI1 homolog [Lethenteron reissneri]|uniref:protein KRI1 homolog n=1 Tax=Lethenteron reissneri TaxID=7753 RepID=UPI002AB5FFB9|nr:protein KRI1 homolog [Lethenteron reissneri]
MDADYVPGGHGGQNLDTEGTGTRRRKDKRRKYAELPADDSELHFESLVGDLPCRFRYREVIANDFGLSTDEILMAEDRELNQWSSLKKTCMYRSEEEELRDLRLARKRAHDWRRKQRILKSLTQSTCPNILLVGEPIAVELTPSPSADDITRLHERYLERLTALFEKHKETYGVPADKQLTFF